MEAINKKDIIFRNIEKIRFIIKDATGLDIMYAYEDLFFAEHGVFLIKIGDKKQNNLECFFNKECNENNSLIMLEKLMISANLNGMTLLNKGYFEMQQNKGEETFSLIFSEKHNV